MKSIFLSGIHLIDGSLLHVISWLCFVSWAFFPSLRVLTHYLGVFAHYLGVLARSPLTTISGWVDKSMLAFFRGVSDMNSMTLGQGPASGGKCLFSQCCFSFNFWFCLLPA